VASAPTPESQNAQPLALRFRARLADETRVELTLV
jgi:hypothetical protein